MRKGFRINARKSSRRSRVVTVIVCLTVLFVPIFLSWSYLRPAFRAHTLASVHSLVLDQMAGCIEEHLVETDTADWFSTRSASAHAQLSYLDLSEVAQFQADVADESNQRLTDLSTLPLRLPIGVLAGWPFWLDGGPKLQARFRLEGPVHTHIAVSGQSEGATSSHVVTLFITAHVHVLGPFLNRTLVVQESTPIAYFLVSPQ